MAFTKIAAAGIGSTETVTLHSLEVLNNATVGGVLTYEDVTNVDSVGLITARNGIVVGSGITLSKDGDVFFTGIATGNGSGLTALNASNLASGTVPTARLGSGTASSSTFLRGDSTFAAVTSTTINSNADNRVITGSDTADTLNGEANLAFDGTGLGLVGHIDIRTGSSINTNVTGGSASGTLHKNTTSGQFAIVSGGTGGNNYLSFFTSASAAPTEKLRIHADGEVEIKEAAAGQTVLSAVGNYSSSGNVDIATFARSGGAVASAIRYLDASTSMLFGTTTSHVFGVMTGGTERLRIDSSGYVMIGNTAASAQYSKDLVVGTTSGEHGITIISQNNSIGRLLFSDSLTSGAATYQGQLNYNHSVDEFIMGTYTSGQIVMKTSNAERLRIKADGLIGIGQATPTHMLHVDSSNASDSTATAFFKGRIVRVDGAAASNSPRLNLSLDGTDKVSILCNRTDSSLNIETLTSAPIIFDTNSSERMRILDGGVCMGRTTTTSYTAALHVSATSGGGIAIATHADTTCMYFNRTDNNAAYVAMRFYTQGGQRGYIQVNTGSTTYSTSGSDIRLKKDIEDWTEEVLPYFKSLKPQKFRFNSEDETVEKTKGYIAQDNLDKFPEAYPLNSEDDRYWFAPQHMIPYLMKALQEEIVKREEIEAKYNALEARIAALEG